MYDRCQSVQRLRTTTRGRTFKVRGAKRPLERPLDGGVDHLSEAQLTDYFSDLVALHSWSTVKLDLYGKFTLLDALFFLANRFL